MILEQTASDEPANSESLFCEVMQSMAYLVLDKLWKFAVDFMRTFLWEGACLSKSLQADDKECGCPKMLL